MHLLWKRYARSGSGSSWFYGAVAGAFGGLIVWAIVAGNWFVATLAAVMVLVTIAGSRLMRRVSASREASRRIIEAPEEEHGR